VLLVTEYKAFLMIDLAAESVNLRSANRNTLENIILPKNRRSFLTGVALIVLAAGWHATHQAPAASPAVHETTSVTHIGAKP
jgi:hypothetical protein